MLFTLIRLLHNATMRTRLLRCPAFLRRSINPRHRDAPQPHLHVTKMSHKHRMSDHRDLTVTSTDNSRFLQVASSQAVIDDSISTIKDCRTTEWVSRTSLGNRRTRRAGISTDLMQQSRVRANGHSQSLTTSAVQIVDGLNFSDSLSNKTSHLCMRSCRDNTLVVSLPRTLRAT